MFFGPSLARLGLSLACLWPPWVCLRRVWARLGQSWACLECVSGLFWGDLGLVLDVLSQSWARLGVSWGVLGSRGGQGAILEDSLSVSSRFRDCLGRQKMGPPICHFFCRWEGGYTEWISNEPHSLDAPQRGAGGFGVGSSLCFFERHSQNKTGRPTSPCGHKFSYAQVIACNRISLKVLVLLLTAKLHSQHHGTNEEGHESNESYEGNEEGHEGYEGNEEGHEESTCR